MQRLVVNLKNRATDDCSDWDALDIYCRNAVSQPQPYFEWPGNRHCEA